MTRLGRLAVYMGWIEDPTELAEGEIPESDASGGAAPGLWDRIMNFFGMGQQEETPQEEPEPYQLPTAEELLGMMCKSFGVKGEGAVDEAAAKESGEAVPTLNIGDMSATDARAVAGVLCELYYRNRITNWPIYYFAEDVDVDFITRVKELGIKGVEIETASVRKAETEFAAHLLGRVGLMDETEQAYYRTLGYDGDESVGKEGVEQAFAVQAGREVRIMVKPDVISDDQVILLARSIAKKIEDTLDYPGQIKVNVIRESRAVEYAK